MTNLENSNVQNELTNYTAAGTNTDAVKTISLTELIENYKNVANLNKEIEQYNDALLVDYCEKRDFDITDADEKALALKKCEKDFKQQQSNEKLLDEVIKTFVTTLAQPFIIINAKMNIDGSFDYSYLLNEKSEKESKKSSKKETLYFTSKDDLINYLTEQNEFTARVKCVWNEQEREVIINIRNYFEKLQETFKQLGKTDFIGFNIYRATKKLA